MITMLWITKFEAKTMNLNCNIGQLLIYDSYNIFGLELASLNGI